MKTLRVLLVTLMLTSAGMARAGMYAKFAGLYSSPGDIQVNNAAAFRASLKSNMGMAIALGYKISAVRADIEIQSFSNSTSSGSTNTGNASTTGGYKQFNGFVNAYVDLPSFVGLSGYVGAGFGEARVDLSHLSAMQGSSNVVQVSGRDKAFGYQVMAGLQYHLLGQATIHAGYRWLHKNDITLQNGVGNTMQKLTLGTDRMFELGVAIGF